MIEIEIDGFLMFDPPISRGYSTQMKKRNCIQLILSKIDLFEKTYPSDRPNLVYKTRGASIMFLNLENDNDNKVILKKSPKNFRGLFCDSFCSSVIENRLESLYVRFNLSPLEIRITKDFIDCSLEIMSWFSLPERTKDRLENEKTEQ